jgi:hypothetical protein
MTALSFVDIRAFRDALLVAGERVVAAREELCELDAVAGDGDLGITLAVGFGHVRDVLESSESPDIGTMLTNVGVTLARKAPSTMGALLASGYIRAGKECHNTVLTADDLASVLESLAAGVTDRGGAGVGQRTIVDAMCGGAVAARNACRDGAPPLDVLYEAAAGARSKAEDTARMEASFGRAFWLKERALGSQDAGAVAWAIYLEGLADGLAQALKKEGDIGNEPPAE